MEKFPINAGNGSQLVSLIEHRLRGDQQLFLVSISSAESAESAERKKARNELLTLIDEMRRTVAASGVSEAELGNAIDETIAEVRATLDEHLHHPDVKAYCSQHGIRVLTDIELIGELRIG